MRYLQKFTRGFRTNLHAEISFIWVFSNSFLSYSHLKYGNAWNADKKIVYTISLLTKKMHLEFRGKRTIIKIASRGPGVGIWFLLTELRSLRGLETFLEFFTLTCLRGNGGWFHFQQPQLLWPLFFAYLFLLSLAHWSHKLCNDHKWSIKRPWKRKIVSGPRKLTLMLRA